MEKTTDYNNKYTVLAIEALAHHASRLSKCNDPETLYREVKYALCSKLLNYDGGLGVDLGNGFRLELTHKAQAEHDKDLIDALFSK